MRARGRRSGPPGLISEIRGPVAEVRSIRSRLPGLRSEIRAPGSKVLENIDVKLTVEVGGAEIKLRELLRINEGSVIELERLAGDPLDILANGTIIAKGEVVMIGERFGIRFTEVVDPKERVQNL